LARQWRVEYEGALYHVMARGNDRRAIFYDDQDRQVFLDILGEMSDRFANEIQVYVLMDNHFHLQIKTLRANLSRCMHWLGVTYATRFNRCHGRVGHVFQGRFKSILVEDELYMNQLSLYIHRNPLRSGLVKRLVDYKWSSYFAYAYGKCSVDWLHRESIMAGYSGKTIQEKQRNYRIAVQEYSEEEQSILENMRVGFILGSKRFVQSIHHRFFPGQSNPELPVQRKIQNSIAPPPAELLVAAADYMDCDIQAMKNSLRIPRSLKANRDLLLYFIWSTGLTDNREIGALFGMTSSSVSKQIGLMRIKIRNDGTLKAKIHELYSLFKM